MHRQSMGSFRPHNEYRQKHQGEAKCLPLMYNAKKKFKRGPSGWFLDEVGPLAEGASESVKSLAELSSLLNVEYNVQINENVKIGLFYHALDTLRDGSRDQGFIKGQLAPTQTALSGLVGATNAEAVVDGVAGGVSNSLAQIEWTDTTSYGVF